MTSSGPVIQMRCMVGQGWTVATGGQRPLHTQNRLPDWCRQAVHLCYTIFTWHMAMVFSAAS